MILNCPVGDIRKTRGAYRADALCRAVETAIRRLDETG